MPVCLEINLAHLVALAPLGNSAKLTGLSTKEVAILPDAFADGSAAIFSGS